MMSTKNGHHSNALIAMGIPLVDRVARRLARRLPVSVDVGDLRGAGHVGLLSAVRTYDPTRNDRFELYAEPRIRGAMLDELRRADAYTRYGRRQLREMEGAQGELERELGRAPTEVEVAARLGVELERYRERAASLIDWKSVPSADETLEPASLVEPEATPADHALRAQRLEHVASAIADLSERERDVLALYYEGERTQAEIAASLGVTESRVCQILSSATSRVRETLRDRYTMPPPSERSARARRAPKTVVVAMRTEGQLSRTG